MKVEIKLPNTLYLFVTCLSIFPFIRLFNSSSFFVIYIHIFFNIFIPLVFIISNTQFSLIMSLIWCIDYTVKTNYLFICNAHIFVFIYTKKNPTQETSTIRFSKFYLNIQLLKVKFQIFSSFFGFMLVSLCTSRYFLNLYSIHHLTPYYTCFISTFSFLKDCPICSFHKFTQGKMKQN